jgi:hypothetical protein
MSDPDEDGGWGPADDEAADREAGRAEDDHWDRLERAHPMH